MGQPQQTLSRVVTRPTKLISVVWRGKAFSEPASLITALARRRKDVQLVGTEAFPLSQRSYRALVDSGFTTIRIEKRHAQWFLSAKQNKTDGQRRSRDQW